MTKLSITKGDKIVIVGIVVICLLILSGFALKTHNARFGNSMIIIRADTNEETQFSLKKPKKLKFKDL